MEIIISILGAYVLLDVLGPFGFHKTTDHDLVEKRARAILKELEEKENAKNN